jgi:hypothetical protein
VRRLPWGEKRAGAAVGRRLHFALKWVNLYRSLQYRANKMLSLHVPLPSLLPPHFLFVCFLKTGLKRLEVTVAATLAVAVALHCIERQTLKPVFHLIGYRLWV